jgi:tRNA A-37 threonylcarbamoyl transferase component Bud32/cytochrome c-type biogenesis protein CcmH/NrfG
MAEERNCPHCGKPVPPLAPGGICPECMLKVGLASQTEAGQSGPQGTKVLSPPPVPEEIAPLFPQLEILECLGRGGMGVVYKARQPKLGRLVALKILVRDRESDPKFAERFTREAQALARLNHPNIVTVHDFGETSGCCYLLMEYVDGLSLRQLIQSGRLKPEEALTIVPQICEALQFAHERGIVHRDIKPENILLDKAGRVKIADFGIAKMLGAEGGAGSPLPAAGAPQEGGACGVRLPANLTDAGKTLGTPHYMAPEQIEEPQRVDHRADIYSLGVVFYEMLTGELPLGKFAPPSRKVQVDVRLDEVVLRTLEREPERRYQHASDVKTDVETIAMTPARAATQSKLMSGQHRRTFWYAAAILAVCLIVGVVGWFLLAGRGNADQLTREGWQLWQARCWADANVKFERAVRLSPGNTNAWNGLGWACFNSGQQARAEKAFQKAVSLDPDYPGALNGLGQLYLVQRKYEQAEKYLLEAAPRAPAAWYGLARLYLIQGKFQQAEPWAQKVVDSGQGDEVARKMLEAAQAKRLSDGLRLMIEPPAQ